MKVLLHALAALEIGGSDRHLRGMLSSLEAVDPSVEYLLYVGTAFPIQRAPGNVMVRSVPLRGLWHRLWWDQVVFPRVAARERADVVWSTLSFGMVRPPVPQVVFQRNAMYYCSAYLSTLGPAESLTIRARRALLHGAMRASRWVIAPTVAMREMIRSFHADLPANRFHVMPHPFDPADGQVSLSPRLAGRLAAGPPDAVRLLYVGHILSFKALPFLLEALRLAVDRSRHPLRLYLTIAREDWAEGYEAFVRRVAELGLEGQVVILGKVPGEMVAGLYRACDVLVFPSLCESFGFPLLEGQAYGLPIVAVDTPVNREVTGNGALYYAPGDPEGAAKVIARIAADPALRETLGQEGRALFEATRITWPDYSRRCLALSRQAVECWR